MSSMLAIIRCRVCGAWDLHSAFCAVAPENTKCDVCDGYDTRELLHGRNAEAGILDDHRRLQVRTIQELAKLNKETDPWE